MRSLTWVAPGGVQLSLNRGDDIFAAPGVQINGLPGAKANLDLVPLQPGGRYHNVRHSTRDVTVPVIISPESGDPIDTERAAGAMLALLDPVRGDGILRVGRHDGTSRELRCRCIDVVAIPEAYADSVSWPAVLTFRAADPYFYDASDSAITVRTGGVSTGTGVDFDDPLVDFDDPTVDFDSGAGTGSSTASFFPFFPLRLGSTEALSSFTVANLGEAESWPVWELVGPASSIIMTNLTTGRTMTFTGSVAAGETLTIDTRPGYKTVVSSLGGDRFAELSNNSSLWPLAIGTNAIDVSMVGATSLSAITARWRRRWLGV